MPSILIVDDEPGVRSALSGVLRDEGYDVDAVESGEACLDRLTRTPYDVVVLDITPGPELARVASRECLVVGAFGDRSEFADSGRGAVRCRRGK